MERIKFNEEQKQELSSNHNIAKVLNCNVVYTDEFKIKSLYEHFEEGISCRQIFKNAGVPDWLNHISYGEKCINRWKNIQKNPLKRKRGRPKKEEKSLEDMSLEELKAQVEYLKIENDFLKKLKALEIQE